MRKKVTTLKSIFLIFLFILLSDSVLGYQTGITYSWDATVPNYNSAAAIHSGILDPSFFKAGDFRGISSTNSNPSSWGTSGAAVGWDDSFTSGALGGNPNANGDFLDGYWAQIVWNNYGWWDLGQARQKIAVFLSQDHGAYLAEGLEYKIWGSNTLFDTSSLGPQATVTNIYLDGWRVHNSAEDINGNGWQSDDIGAILNLGGSYRYIALQAWTSVSALNEPEVDAVGAVVPIPTTLLLFSTGLMGLVGLRRRLSKKVRQSIGD